MAAVINISGPTDVQHKLNVQVGRRKHSVRTLTIVRAAMISKRLVLSVMPGDKTYRPAAEI